MPSRPPGAPPRRPPSFTFVAQNTSRNWWDRAAQIANVARPEPAPSESTAEIAARIRTLAEAQASIIDPPGGWPDIVSRSLTMEDLIRDSAFLDRTATARSPTGRTQGRETRMRSYDPYPNLSEYLATHLPDSSTTKEASMASKPAPFVFSLLPELQPAWLRGRRFSDPPSLGQLDKLADESNEPFPRVYTIDAGYTSTHQCASDVCVVTENYLIHARMGWNRYTQSAHFDPSRLRNLETAEVTPLTRPRTSRRVRDFECVEHQYCFGELMPIALGAAVRRQLKVAVLKAVSYRRSRLVESRFGFSLGIRPTDDRAWRLSSIIEDTYGSSRPQVLASLLKARADFGESIKRILKRLRETTDTPHSILGDEGFYDSDAFRTRRSFSTFKVLDAFNKARPSLNLRPTFSVASCGHITPSIRAVSTNDGDVCPRCAEERYRFCVDTQCLHHRDYCYLWDSDDEYRTYAEPADDDDDDDSPDADSMMSYDTDVLRHLCIDPSFRSSADGDFHMGIELETIYTGPAHVNRKVREVRAELGADYLVAKYDGSLSSDRGSGIEWVTRPTSMTTHVAKLKSWGESAKGLVAWDANCCGMHTHIDSRAFTATTLGKLLQFFNAEGNVDFIRSIAGRHPDRDRHAGMYAARDLVASEAATPMRALKGKESAPSRYTMINLTNLSEGERTRLHVPRQHGNSTANTVEIRIYRASLSKPRLLAQVEFTHALICYCRVASFRKMNGDAFKEWLGKRVSTYPHLAAFLKVAPNKHGRRTKDAAPTAVEV